MHLFSVSDMTCGHCVSAVTKAVRSVDAQAKVEASLGDKRVVVQSSLSQQEIAEAIQEAGYTPRLES